MCLICQHALSACWSKATSSGAAVAFTPEGEAHAFRGSQHPAGSILHALEDFSHRERCSLARGFEARTVGHTSVIPYLRRGRCNVCHEAKLPCPCVLALGGLGTLQGARQSLQPDASSRFDAQAVVRLVRSQKHDIKTLRCVSRIVMGPGSKQCTRRIFEGNRCEAWPGTLQPPTREYDGECAGTCHIAVIHRHITSDKVTLALKRWLQRLSLVEQRGCVVGCGVHNIHTSRDALHQVLQKIKR